MFFDLCCQIYITSVFLKHRRMGISKTSLVSACRYMEQVDLGLQLHSDAHAFFQVIAAFKQLRAA